MKAPLSRTEFRLLKMLEGYAGKSKTCYPSQRTLARDLKRTERTIRRALVALEVKRGITWRRGATAHNVYNLKHKMSGAADINEATNGSGIIKLTFKMSGYESKMSGKTSAEMSGSSLISEATLNQAPNPLPESEIRKEKIPMANPYVDWNPQRSPEERKLLRLARRWCDRHAPDALWPLDGLIVAQQLHDAGALALDDNAPWCDWPQIEGLRSRKPESQKGKPETIEARERLRATIPPLHPMEDLLRKPVSTAEAIREMRKVIGESE